MKKVLLITALTFCKASPVLCQYSSFTRGDSLKIENLKKNLPGLKGLERVDALNQLSESYGLYIGFGQFMPKKEISSNIYFYAKEANNEALKIDYKYGIAKSLRQLSEAIVAYDERSTGGRNKDTIIKIYLQQAIIMRKDLLNDDLIGQEAATRDHEYEIAKSLLVLSEAIDAYLQPFWFEKDTVTKKCLQNVIRIGEKLHNDSIIGAAYYYLGWFVEDQETNYKKAIFHFQKAGELQQETEVTWQLCAFYSFKGRFEVGFPYCEKFAQLAKENVIKDSSHQADRLVQNSDYYMYEYYNAAGDYETALDFLLKGNNYAIKNNLPWKMDLSISELYCKMDKPDSALRYWNLWKKDYNSNSQGLQENGNLIHAEIYILKSQPDSAVPIIENSMAQGKMRGPSQTGALIRPLLLRAEVYKQKKDYKKALQDAREAVEYAEQDNARTMDGYHLLSLLYYQLGQHKEAYQTLMKYLAIKDSIQSRQFLIRLKNYKREAEDAKKESRIGFLNRDNQIKQQQLKQQSLVKNFLIVGLLVFILAGIFVYRSISFKRRNERLQREQLESKFKLQQLENEKKQAELQQQAAELEMQA
ncbi:MAG: tetratricopeptide repeat protein, partial [Chitinophagales bacterium]